MHPFDLVVLPLGISSNAVIRTADWIYIQVCCCSKMLEANTIEELLNELWYIHQLKYYTTIKNSGFQGAFNDMKNYS